MKRYVCLDIEMSEIVLSQRHMIRGLRNEVIQLGAVMLDENYTLISRFSSYVKPAYSSITPAVASLTGITNSLIEEADDFVTAFDKYCYWLGDNDVTTFCWSASDYNQLWNELTRKAKHRQDLFETLKTFVDLQKTFCTLIGAKKVVSLEAALRFFHTRFKGRIHTADGDAFNTARILYKICRTKSLKPYFDYLYLTETPEDTLYSKKAKAVRISSADYNTTMASFMTPELLSRFIYEPEIPKETKMHNSIIALFIDKYFMKNLCAKYKVSIPLWLGVALKTMFTGEIKAANLDAGIEA